MSLIVIRNRYTNEVIYSGEGETIRQIVEAAVASRANLTGANLADAYLAGANLADANLTGANLADANLTGANLARANLTRANLADAYLAGANLAGANLTRANLADAYLAGANLADANLTGANLTGANLADAYLADANLADFHEVVVQSLHRKILAAIDAGGTLDMGKWHTCETTHCRAGWAVHLAGPAGSVLERCMGPSVAGAIIHLASCPQLEGRVPNFHATDEAALADIRRLAELEPPIALESQGA